MIVSVMFYALYPLSRLIGRVLELWHQAPSVCLNGREVWDGGGQQQTCPSLQWNTTEDTLEGPEQHHAQTLVENLERRVEDKQEDLQKTLYDVSQMEGVLSETHHTDPVVSESEDARSPISLPLSTDDHSGAETNTSDASPNVLQGFSSGSEALLQSRSPVFDLAALLSETQQVQAPAEPVGWHFPIGHGLSQMCYCPYVQFPDVSYYPAFQDSDNIEVMWRVWEDLSETHSNGSADAAAVFDFSIMSYNILAQDLLEANPHLYTHCPENTLVWENRLQTILKELRIWQPDIICLQEVQEDHFLEQMHPVLTEMGYTCIYKRRTGTKTDGCAVCYLGERFTQLSVSLLEFRRTDCELLDRDNVGIVLLLQPMAGPSDVFTPVCVANTHLLFNPSRGDVKLAQLALMFAEIDSMAWKCKRKGGSCEVILCGDFNALPSSPLWTLITTGQLYYHGLPTWMVSGQVDLSYKVHHNRLSAPLWPTSLGINDRCQYKTDTQTTSSGLDITRKYSHEFMCQLRFCEAACVRPADLKLIRGVTDQTPAVKRKYSHEFMCQLRFCEAACVRPADLELIRGVTDQTPDPEVMQLFSPSFSHCLRHTLSLTSAYSHVHPDPHSTLVTTLNSEGAAMVDYIFYSQRWRRLGRSGGLKLLARLSLLSEAHLWSLRGLPSEIFPSDHLSLLVKLQLSSATI